MHQHITVNTKIGDVIDHPAFNGKGILIFPWDDRQRNCPEKTMKYAPKLHLWHTHMDPQQMVDCVNRLIDDVNDGKQVIYDFYSEQEKKQDPEKKNTGLIFFPWETRGSIWYNIAWWWVLLCRLASCRFSCCNGIE